MTVKTEGIEVLWIIVCAGILYMQVSSEHPQVVEVYEEVQNGETQSNSCIQLFS